MPNQTQLFFTKSPQGVYPAYQKFVVSADAIANLVYSGGSFIQAKNRKYLLEISINNTVVAILKAPPNEFDRANFHLEKIFQDYLLTDTAPFHLEGSTSVESIHKITGFRQNMSTLIQVDLRVGEEYTLNNTFISSFRNAEAQSGTNAVSDKFFVFNGCRQHNQGESATFVQNHKLNSIIGLFLSDAEHVQTNLFSPEDATTDAQIQKIRTNDYAVLGMFNRNHLNHFNNYTRAQISLYDSNNALIGNFTVNNGFEDTADAVGMTQRTGLVWFPVGMQNFRDMSITTETNLNNTVRYMITVENDSNATKSKALHYEVVDEDCKGFETIRLAWVNSLGCWDYYNFDKRSTRTTQSRRTTYEANFGMRQDSDSNGYDYLTSRGGKQVLSNQATEIIEANTDFIDEGTATFLKNCFTSPQVHMQVGTGSDAVFEPVIVTETEYLKQTSSNDKVIQYVITIEKSHKHIVQRQG
tara:strand:- start:1054 stop:2460 length:1407 start_codon:yes stop_codon:yes gene_type:complete